MNDFIWDCTDGSSHYLMRYKNWTPSEGGVEDDKDVYLYNGNVKGCRQFLIVPVDAEGVIMGDKLPYQCWEVGGTAYNTKTKEFKTLALAKAYAEKQCKTICDKMPIDGKIKLYPNFK